MISIVILTKNEELDINACLMSIQWSDDIHILDSGSTDKTLEIVKQYPVKVSSNPFVSFGKQRNFALANLPFKYDWILFLDADEIVTEKFHAALIESVTHATNDIAGFYCCWKMMLEDKWLKHSDNFPKWQFRLLRIGKAEFTDFGHGQKEKVIEGRIEYINEPYLHYGFSKGWSQWIDRHNKYSSLEAQARISNRPPLKNIFNANGSIRNPALKSWLSSLPGWPFMRFAFSYIFKLGFLEGMAGFIYCTNMGFYEYLIKIKMREIRNLKKTQAVQK
jgi:glycosyltransferase involved in cell wall biosynthesis